MKQKTTSMAWAAAALVGVLATAAAPSAEALPGDLGAEEYVTGLQFPVHMAVLSDGDLLVTEKMGAVRLVRAGQLQEAPVAEFRVKAQNEAGLLGITLMPDFAESGEFIVAYTPRDDGEHMYVSRLRLEGDRATVLDDPWLELPSKPGTDRHFGGVMRFGPDGHLFISAGDLRERARAQNVDVVSGSVLRYNADLSVPEDNPFGADNPVYAYGVRAGFGLDVGPDGSIFLVENGDDVADELHHITAGGNYGWPLVQGHCDNFPLPEPCGDEDLFEAPIHEFRTIVGPTSVHAYAGELIPELEGALFVTGWHSGLVHRFAWDAEAGTATEQTPLFEKVRSEATGFTDVATAHDGAILVIESGVGVGTIYRIAPKDHLLDPDRTVQPGQRDADSGGCSATGPGGVPLAPWALLVFGMGVAVMRRR